MATRIAIELSPLVYRIVEVAGAPMRASDESRVQGFAAAAPGNLTMRERIARLRRKSVAAIVWGVPNEHRQVDVAAGSMAKMRAEAIDALRDLTGGAPIDTRRVFVDIAPAGVRDKHAVLHRVVIAMADAAGVRAAIKPLTDAGIRVRTVVTPALALLSLARLRRSLTVPGTLEAYVALQETATCIALMRDGALVSARELPWGFLDETSVRRDVRPRDQIASRLGDELATAFAAASEEGPVSQVCICGALPELRSTTIPLMERFDVEVETLDSLVGIDATHLPDPADEFRDRVAELRLAWAVAADRPPIDLLREERRRVVRTAVTRAAIAAGIVAGVGGGLAIERSGLWRSMTAAGPSPKPVTQIARRTRPAPPVAPRRSAPAKPPVAAKSGVPMPVVAPKPTVPSPPPVVAAKSTTPPAQTSASVPSAVARNERPTPPVVAPPAAAPKPVAAAPKASVPPPPKPLEQLALTPREARPATGSPAPPAPRPAAPPAVTRVEPPAARRIEPSVARRVEPPAVSRVEPPVASRVPPPAPRRAETPLPFDASLGTILYGSDRQLAIIDGRIVQPGDEIRGARIVDISPSAVLLRDAQGRLRQLTLGSPAAR